MNNDICQFVVDIYKQRVTKLTTTLYVKKRGSEGANKLHFSIIILLKN